jgi:hypothetical protein
MVHADGLSFGPFDIPTLFFIDKSDDRNRVDYGIRLDEQCVPKEDAIFAYWREFEHAPPVRTHSLNLIEPLAYGISEQHAIRRTPASTEYVLILKRFRRPIFVSLTKEADGHCAALPRTTVAGVEGVQLLSVYVKLGGVLSVDYVVVRGRDLKTGQLVEERLTR